MLRNPHQTLLRGRRRRSQSARKGAVAVEFAVTASMLFLIVFGLFEFSRANMIRNTVENAAYEGCRAAALPGATDAKVQVAASAILDALGITATSIDFDDSIDGEVTVEVIVPMDSTNAFFITKYCLGKNITGTCTFHVEET
ncbi:MAG: TadE/TadG family type IV pilus assembly protein, partial [Planctomycetota bacterium]